MFIGTPHTGSDVVEETKLKLQNLVNGLHPLNDAVIHMFDKAEFVENFF